MGNSSNNYAHLERDIDLFVSIYGMFIIVVGTTGNVLTLIVIIYYYSMKATTRLLFFILGFSDLVALPLAATRYWYEAMYHFDIRDKDAISCKLHSFFTTTGLNMAMWTIVLISMERFCQTLFPNRSHPFSTMKWTVFSTLAIFVILVGKNCPLLTRNYENHHCGATTLFDLGSVSLTDCMIGYLFPGALVLAFTISILLKIRRHHRKVVVAENSAEIRATRYLMSATLMLLGVALSRLVIGVPGYVASCLYHDTMLQSQPLISVYRVLFILMVTNNGANFYLYLISAQNFRSQFQGLLKSMKGRVLKMRVEN